MKLNTNFFGKETFKKYLYNHQSYEMIIVLFGIILTYKTISPFYSTFLIFGLGFYAYFIHILLHMMPEKYKVHLLLHNNKESGKNILHNIKSIILDMSCFFILYYLQILMNYEVFPPILILYYSIIYITVNNINYSIFNIGNNKNVGLLEKEEMNTIFGRNSLDHLLGTNQDSVFEHMYHYILNTIFAFLVTVIIFCDKNDVL
jgi:hypothetical protein